MARRAHLELQRVVCICERRPPPRQPREQRRHASPKLRPRAAACALCARAYRADEQLSRCGVGAAGGGLRKHHQADGAPRAGLERDGDRGVDAAIIWDDGGQTVIGAIADLKPDFFTKGGDRQKPEDVAEWDICQEVGCKVLFNVGGGKVQSSSWLLQKAEEDND